ncbi:tail fiber domain-containing protein [Flavobacterium sp. AS60]|uniref:tail fiber domain-containing protein n=1 Tax=Flavobacterium anseongense TaxID=2910677 RepID=UPI001F2AA8D3|nr:tail fiber domain-containing protein [Flavobacterium sp. AS60]MCF6130617.1 tail fiber domain-containing protein [Flavobacterium sp. AS60]
MKSFLFSIFSIFFLLHVNAQVGIGTTSPDASSILDITSTDGGLLIPRIGLTSSTDTVTIASPATSLLVYNTGLGGLSPAGYYYWNGTSWITLAGSGGSNWTLTGNSGTSAGTNFIGTADAVDLRIKTGGSDRLNISNANGQIQSYTTSGSASTPSYSFSGTQTSTGMFNPATDNLGFATAGTERVRIQADGDVGIGTTPNASAKLEINATDRGLLIPNVALEATNNGTSPIASPATSLLVYNTATAGTSPNNVVPGYYYWDGVWVPLATGLSNNNWNILGNTNIVDGTNFMGTGASTNVDVAFRRNNAAAGKIGATSTSFGVGALPAGAATTSTAFGTNALLANTTGANNVAVGNGALAANISGAGNTAVGTSALALNTATGNTALGISALAANTNATNNTAVGNLALAANNTGTDNTSLGFQALRNNTGAGATNTAVGSNALFTNTTAAGNTAVGFSALRLNAATTGNTAVGYQALRYHIAANNTAVGYDALRGAAAGMNASAANNTAVGYAALTANLVGASNTALGASALAANTATGNTAVGSSALAANTSATGNTAVGSSALAANSTGARNTALGTSALAANNTPADNTAIGYNALAINTFNAGGGNQNTAVGSGALAALNGGVGNTAVGYNALTANATLALYNTAVGALALSGINNAASRDNVAVGYSALMQTGVITDSVALGSGALTSAANTSTRNTAVGKSAGSNLTTGTDNVLIGTNTQTSAVSATREIVIGSAAVAGSYPITIGGGAAYSGAYVNAPSWSFSSDRRLKSDILDSPLGLAFIKTLRPVSYYRKADVNKKTEYGFIAQELEVALNNAGSTNNGILGHTSDGMYAVRYNDFLPITIKAVQEQQTEIEALKKANSELLKANEAILKRLEALEKK